MSEQDEEGIPVPPGCHVAKAGRWEGVESSGEHSWLGRGFVKSNSREEADERFTLLGTLAPG